MALVDEGVKVAMSNLCMLSQFRQSHWRQGSPCFYNGNKFTGNSLEFSRQILEKTGVTTSGIDFGSGGEGHVIFSYANSLGNIEKGMKYLMLSLTGNFAFLALTQHLFSFDHKEHRTGDYYYNYPVNQP